MKITKIFLWYLVFFLSTITALYAQQNKELIEKLDSLAEYDQRHRGKEVKAAADKFGWESAEVKTIWKKQELLDSKALTGIEKILTEVGYPGKTMVGDKRKSIAFLVVQHAELAVREKYINLFTSAADKGEMAWSSLALMIDRNKTERNEFQVYGSQMLEKDNTIKLFPIVDEPNVDQRRAKVGLGPLAVYLKEFGINYILPTAENNPNPKSLYVDLVQPQKSSVALIGGIATLYSKLVYPPQAKKQGILGKVTLEFVIDAAGKPKDIWVVKSLGKECDEEAIRVLKEARYMNSSGLDHQTRMNFPFPYQP